MDQQSDTTAKVVTVAPIIPKTITSKKNHMIAQSEQIENGEHEQHSNEQQDRPHQ